MPFPKLSDDEQCILLAAAWPLDRDYREPFMRAVVDALQMREVIGPGLV